MSPYKHITALLGVIVGYLLFVVCNILFYTFISISLYKYLCYESNTTNVFLFLNEIKKQTILFYYFNTNYIYFFIGGIKQTILLLDYLDITKNTIFLNLYKFKKIHGIYFFFEHISETNSIYFNNNLVFLNFFIRVSNINWINAISLQKTIIINVNESSLFFFRMYNPSHICISLVTLYMIYPNNLTLFVNKIQCFCFNTVFLYPMELVDLPVLIYINTFLDVINNMYLNNILIYYVVFLQ